MRLAILWHFHQPVYKKPGSDEFILPWVNFHTTKNYWQMGRLAEEEGWPCTYNFVPCLLEQMEDYVSGRAIDPWQSALEKPPSSLTESELALLRMFVPGECSDPATLQRKAFRTFFSPVDDVPEDRERMLQRQAEIRTAIVPLFRRLWEEGRVELTTSAFYHPILPMLCDAAAAGPESPPDVEFRFPQDAAYQLLRGREYFTRVFSRAPRGLWPSEGGVSRAMARAAVEAGFAFAVTDENILWKSLRRARDFRRLCRPYDSDGLTVFFRDLELSDLIGFEYHRWNEKDAADDLVRRILDRGREAGKDAILTLALDGENPWGNYHQNGVPFLRRLFARLAEEKSIRPAFFGDKESLLAEKQEPLELVPGTWLGNFSKWAGSPAKNCGWSVLARARAACGPTAALYVAEGSDWFWWFGEEPHPAFGQLFRLYIDEAYRQTGVAAP